MTKAENIYEELDLPLTSKMQEVKNAYESKLNDLEKQGKSSDKKSHGGNDGIESKKQNLKNLFYRFKEKVGATNARTFETKEALKNIGLSAEDDWDKVRNLRAKMKNEDPEKEKDLEKEWDILEKNKDMITPKGKKQSYLKQAVAVGAAGLSLAAFHYFSNAADANDPLDADNDLATSLDDEVTQGALLDPEAMNEYINNNTGPEDEMMSLLGLAPDPTVTLGVDFKIQVLQSLIKTI